jgi:hypothetical protein
MNSVRPFRTQALHETLSSTIKHLGPGSRRYTRLVQDERCFFIPLARPDEALAPRRVI